jgi:hypothetical protein
LGTLRKGTPAVSLNTAGEVVHFSKFRTDYFYMFVDTIRSGIRFDAGLK